MALISFFGGVVDGLSTKSIHKYLCLLYDEKSRFQKFLTQCVNIVFVKSMKTGTLRNKAIHSIPQFLFFFVEHKADFYNNKELGKA